MISAGRVLIIPKGDYDSTVTYEMLDLVSYQGSSYIAKQSTTGNLPTNTTYFQLCAFGSASTNVTANFATLETSAIAANAYSVGDFLVDVNSNLCEVIVDIAVGDQILIGSNVKKTTVDAMVQTVVDSVSDLDAAAKQLAPKIAITSAASLGDIVDVGEYYKSSTGFAVTDAPLEINGESSATFRLVVERGADSATILQSLITNTNNTYTRGYYNSTWSAWTEAEKKLSFVGTSDEWEALSTSEKALYTFVVLE